MSLRLLFELVLAVYLLTLVVLAVLTATDWWRDANARHRIRKLVDAELAGRLAEDQQVAWLDGVWELPTRDPRA